jgi:Tol biopolymer transport system component
VWIVPVAGGTAEQITHETGGAFTPVWTADGQSIIYESASANESIARVNVNSGVTTTLATDSLGVSQPSCNATICVAITDASGSGGVIVSFSATSTSAAPTKVVLARTNNARQPAILVAAH